MSDAGTTWRHARVDLLHRHYPQRLPRRRRTTPSTGSSPCPVASRRRGRRRLPAVPRAHRRARAGIDHVRVGARARRPHRAPREVAGFYGAAPHVGVPEPGAAAVPAPTCASPPATCRTMARRSARPPADRDVWIVGGGDLVGQFADAGLLDEMRVSIAPATLSSGKPLLPRRLGADRLDLRLSGRPGSSPSSTYAVRARVRLPVEARSSPTRPNFGSRPSPDDVPVSRRRTHGPTCSR